METNIYTREQLENLNYDNCIDFFSEGKEILFKDRNNFLTYVACRVASLSSSNPRKERGTKVLETFDFINKQIDEGDFKGVDKITLKEYYNIIQCLDLSSMVLINKGVITAQCHSSAKVEWQGD